MQRPGRFTTKSADQASACDSGYMTKNGTSSTKSTWTGMVPVDDTALAVTDTGGPVIPVVYVNGQFATPSY